MPPIGGTVPAGLRSQAGLQVLPIGSTIPASHRRHEIVPSIGGTIPAGTIPPGPSPRRAGMPPIGSHCMPPPESRRRPGPPVRPMGRAARTPPPPLLPPANSPAAVHRAANWRHHTVPPIGGAGMPPDPAALKCRRPIGRRSLQGRPLASPAASRWGCRYAPPLPPPGNCPAPQNRADNGRHHAPPAR